MFSSCSCYCYDYILVIVIVVIKDKDKPICPIAQGDKVGSCNDEAVASHIFTRRLAGYVSLGEIIVIVNVFVFVFPIVFVLVFAIVFVFVFAIVFVIVFVIPTFSLVDLQVM